jgi:hypothetical protein
MDFVNGFIEVFLSATENLQPIRATADYTEPIMSPIIIPTRFLFMLYSLFTILLSSAFCIIFCSYTTINVLLLQSIYSFWRMFETITIHNYRSDRVLNSLQASFFLFFQNPCIMNIW